MPSFDAHAFFFLFYADEMKVRCIYISFPPEIAQCALQRSSSNREKKRRGAKIVFPYVRSFAPFAITRPPARVHCFLPFAITRPPARVHCFFYGPIVAVIDYGHDDEDARHYIWRLMKWYKLVRSSSDNIVLLIPDLSAITGVYFYEVNCWSRRSLWS